MKVSNITKLFAIGLLMGNLALFAMQPNAKVSTNVKAYLTSWKNESDKNLLFNTADTKGTRTNIAKLSANSERKFDKEIPLFDEWDNGVYQETIWIEEIDTPFKGLALNIKYDTNHLGAQQVRVELDNRITGSVEDLDEQILDISEYISKNNKVDLLIQGTIKGNNLEQSKFEIVPIAR